MTTASRFLFASALAVLILSGCRCDTSLNQKTPEIAVSTESIDFGRVEVEFEHTQTMVITNNGTVNLNISELRIAEPFAVKAEVPLSVGPNESFELPVTFFATRPDVRETGTLVIVSDDPNRFELSVALAGTGVAGVASVMPAAVDFGEVYLGEPKALMVTVTNLGTAPLRTISVTPPAVPSITTDFAPLQERIPAAGSAAATLTFLPTAMGEVTGELVITYPEDQGGAVTVPVRGKGIAALPQLCVESLQTGTENCTPLTATSGNGQGNVVLQLPAACDIELFPPGSGSTACSEETATTRARLRVKNAGNTPVEYTLSFDREVGGNPCGLMDPPPPDFQFSNAPMLTDGGFAKTWSEATTSLPLMPTDPPPYERVVADIAYRATSVCEDAASEQARIVFDRQGVAGRDPDLLSVILQGNSKLPRLETVDWSCTASGGPCASVLRGVVNFGPAPAEVTSVRVVQLLGTDGGFLCGAPLDAGTPIDCALDGTNTLDNCSHFRWTVDGGSPEPRLPIFVDAGSSSVASFGRLGVLEFAHDGFGCGGVGGGVCGGQEYCLYGVIGTNDPYNPELIINIEGHAN